MQTVVEKVIEIIGEQVGIDSRVIKPEQNIREDLGFDSLAALELTMELEEAFDIEIPDKHAANLLTVKQIIDYVESKVNKERGPSITRIIRQGEELSGKGE
jgi:acyl carrier protein